MSARRNPDSPPMSNAAAVTTRSTYDAIVVGSGISGGWAAKELCEKGLKVLLLERGRDVKHGDYPTAMLDAWDFAGRTRAPAAAAARQEKQGRTGYTTHPASAHWFVDDVDHPYEEKKRFDWMRGYHVGGRSLLWGRQSYRFSDLDFEANAKEGVASTGRSATPTSRHGTTTSSASLGSAVRRRACRNCPTGSSCRRWR